jgi:dihydroxy-acid dehydratase
MGAVTGGDGTGLRSRQWWDNPANPEMTALYLERYLNFGLTRAELQSRRPIVGIAQTGNDLVPCNRHHVELAGRVRDGIRDAGGIPLEFPVHPLQETGKRPTAALDRNLAYLNAERCRVRPGAGRRPGRCSGSGRRTAWSRRSRRCR